MHANHSTRSLLLALLVTGTLLGCSPEEQFTEVSQELNRDDYMSSELRARVETLKSAVATEATSENTIAERAGLLADWVDAYALAGGEVGVDATRIRLQSTLPPRGRQAVNQSRNVDRFVREFTLRDEDGALGLLRSDNLGPFVAGTMDTLSQTWRVGTRSMAIGGGFWVARHFAANFGVFQS